MPTEQKPPIAIVNEYVPPRPPPTKEEMRAESKFTPIKPVDWDDWHTQHWYLKPPKHKFLVSSGIWFVSALLTWFIAWSDVGGSVGGVPILIALLGWPIPLFYLIKWLWQEIRNK